MDKELNLILKLADHPSNSTEAGKLQARLEKAVELVKELGEAEKKAAEKSHDSWRKKEEAIRRYEEAKKRVRDLEAKDATYEAAHNAGIKVDQADWARTADALKQEQKLVKDLQKEVNESTREWEKNRRELDKNTAAVEKYTQQGVDAVNKIKRALSDSEREVERHVNAKNKAYQKLFQHVAGGFQSTISLAKSAALAYASAMDTDDETVKKWLQWFAAIESVSQAITGVYGTYKALRGIMEALNLLRVKDIALAQAQARAEALVCAAKQCGIGVGGGAKGPSGGSGWLGAAGSFLQRAAPVGRAALALGGGIAAGIAGGVGLGAGIGLAASGFQDTGPGGVAGGIASPLISFAGMIGTEGAGSLFQPYARAAYNQEVADRMARRLPQQRQATQMLFNQQYNSRENVAGRLTRAADSIAETENAVAGMGWGTTKNKIRVTQAQYDASEQAARRLRSGADSMETMEGGREQAAEMRKRAAEQELQAVQQLIELKRLQQQLDMEAAQRDVNAAKTRQQMAEAESEFYKAIVDDVKREREQVTGRMAGAKGGEIRRGFSAREKAEAGGDLTYREAMAMRNMGLDTNEKLRQAVQSAMEREVIRKGGPQAAEYYERLRREQEAAQQGSDLYGAEARGAKADVKIAQSIVVELKKEQDNELEALMESLEPSLRKLLAERNEQLEKAIEEGIRNGVLQTVLKMSEEELTQNVLKGGSQ